MQKNRALERLEPQNKACADGDLLGQFELPNPSGQVNHETE